MYTAAFIDFENIEKSVKQNFGSVLDYDNFVDVIREVAHGKGSRVVHIAAYGDFDKGEAGLQTRLMHLGVQPKHVVTKTAHEYLKGSTDIELSLDILETMYTYPHITDFMFISGDGDLRHVTRRLQLNGKNVQLIGFKEHTSNLLIQMVNEYISLDQFPRAMRKVTKTEKEKKMLSLAADEYVHKVIFHLDLCERTLTKKFIGLNYFRRRLIERFPVTNISDALTDSLENDLIHTYQVENPEDPYHPTTACILNRENPVVRQILDQKDPLVD